VSILSGLAAVSRSARIDRWPVVGPLVRSGGRLLNDWAHRDSGVPALVDERIEIRLSPLAYSGGAYAFDPALTAELMAIARPGVQFLDVGAHIGIASLIYAKLAGPNTRVCALEPNPYAFPTLVENSRVNGMPVECLRLALGSEVGQVAFFSSGRDPNGSLSHDAPGKYWYWDDRPKPVLRETRVTMSTLDRLCAAIGFEPGIVKLDVEGAELQVLRGGPEVLARCRPLILLETHVFAWESFGYSGRDLESEIARLGYSICDPLGEPFTGVLGTGPQTDNNHFLLKPR
jgi:FkbM family methyltransferase